MTRYCKLHCKESFDALVNEARDKYISYEDLKDATNVSPEQVGRYVACCYVAYVTRNAARKLDTVLRYKVKEQNVEFVVVSLVL